MDRLYHSGIVKRERVGKLDVLAQLGNRWEAEHVRGQTLIDCLVGQHCTKGRNDRGGNIRRDRRGVLCKGEDEGSGEGLGRVPACDGVAVMRQEEEDLLLCQVALQLHRSRKVPAQRGARQRWRQRGGKRVRWCF